MGGMQRPGMQRAVHFVSLGCPKNRVDTEVMLGASEHAGFRRIAAAERAEVIVVNTCGFIEAAKQESIDTILELSRHKQEGACRKLVVAGCLAQRYPRELAEQLPEVDHFLGTADLLRLPEILASSDAKAAGRVLVGNPADYLPRANDPRTLSGPAHSAYVKIAEGCSRRCSFCAIPSFRGRQRSRPIRDLMRECERLLSRGVVELNLVSQDTVRYGRDLASGDNLTRLVAALAELPGLHWLRLFYLYPERLDRGLLELLGHHPKVVPYLDMPLQHASDRMLRRMRRGHGGTRLRRLIERVRREVPGATLRSAFIVGHPGESEADFAQLEGFVRWAELDHLGVFLYSAEEGTPSASQAEAVAPELAQERQRRLLSLQRSISRRKLRALVGRTLQVLVDGVSPESEWVLEGRHPGQAPEVDGMLVLVNGTARSGELREARVTASGDYDLVADLIAEDGSKPARPPGPRGSLHLPIVH